MLVSGAAPRARASSSLAEAQLFGVTYPAARSIAMQLDASGRISPSPSKKQPSRPPTAERSTTRPSKEVGTVAGASAEAAEAIQKMVRGRQARKSITDAEVDTSGQFAASDGSCKSACSGPHATRPKPSKRQTRKTGSIQSVLKKTAPKDKKGHEQGSLDQAGGNLGDSRMVDTEVVGALIYRLIALDPSKAWGQGKLIQLVEKHKGDEELTEALLKLLGTPWRNDPIRDRELDKDLPPAERHRSSSSRESLARNSSSGEVEEAHRTTPHPPPAHAWRRASPVEASLARHRVKARHAKLTGARRGRARRGRTC